MNTFIEELKAKIQLRSECKNCPLRNKVKVFFEKLYSDDSSCDVLFYGINPGKKEAEEGRPFCGPSGKILRKYLQDLGLMKYKIAFTNAILCSTPNEKDIPDVEKCIDNCKSLVRDISNYLKPKLYIPVGRNCTLYLFKIDGGITQISGSIFKGKVIPIIHPASLIYNQVGPNKDIFERSLKNILTFLEGK